MEIDWNKEEIHACTAVLKKYLRDLPQPLFSPELVRIFVFFASTSPALTSISTNVQYSCFMAVHSTFPPQQTNVVNSIRLFYAALLTGDTEEAAMAKIGSLIETLPGPCLRLIKYVFDFLVLVATESAHNKMHLQNLAVRIISFPFINCCSEVYPLPQLIFGPIMIGSDENASSAEVRLRLVIR